MLLLFNTTLGPPRDSFAKEMDGMDPDARTVDPVAAIVERADRRETSGDGSWRADVNSMLLLVSPIANSIRLVGLNNFML